MIRQALLLALLLASAVLLTVQVTPAAAQEGDAVTTRQNPEFGTDPSGTRLPETAIDTETLPNIVLDPNAPDDKPLPFYEIAPDTYMLYGNVAEVDEYNRGFNGNAGFVVTRGGVFVIDALGTPKLGRRFIATIRSVTDQPIRYVALTHNHPDHSYGAIAFRRATDAEFIAHEGTLDYIYSEQVDRSVAYRRGFIEADMAGFEVVEPDILIDEEPFHHQTFEVGDERFAIYNVGAHHSHGDLLVHQKGRNIVWISDLAFNQRVTYMGDGDSEQAIESQDWLMEKFGDARLMVPGHGSAQTEPFPMVTKTQRYMKRMRQTMSEAIDAGKGLQQAVDEAEFPEWKDVRLYELNQRPNANFVYREMEMELF